MLLLFLQEVSEMIITTKIITRSALFLAVAIAIQSVKLPQFVTGPLVNTTLYLAVALVGTVSAVMIGFFTPVIAFLFGIMKLPPAVPVIMAGNVALALIFGQFKMSPIIGVLTASVSKFVVMFLGVKYILPVLLNINLPAKGVTLLTTPQLFTALAGGVVAILILKIIQSLQE